jgi:hypothetical protein
MEAVLRYADMASGHGNAMNPAVRWDFIFLCVAFQLLIDPLLNLVYP